MISSPTEFLGDISEEVGPSMQIAQKSNIDQLEEDIYMLGVLFDQDEIQIWVSFALFQW